MFAPYTETFTLMEWLALTGLTQCMLILVYVCFRVRRWSQAVLAAAYFLLLALAFAAQFALRLEDYADEIRFALWFLWMAGPPLSYLLILQVARPAGLPPGRHFWVLAPLVFVPALFLVLRGVTGFCDNRAFLCERQMDWLYILGVAAGGISLLLLWAEKGLFSDMRRARGGSERYWLVLALVAMNVMILGVETFRLFGRLAEDDADRLLVTIGLSFVYLATTTLFRIYPPPVPLAAYGRRLTDAPTLDAAETELAARITKLMTMDKVYQEPSYSRADLARELEVSETQLSRVINAAFGKSFPRMINEYRVQDAKRLLEDPAIPVNVAAEQAGFNSLASFNRVFREITGMTPSFYRNEKCG